jgi:N-acetylmuramoyl-L-alanine amidase
MGWFKRIISKIIPSKKPVIIAGKPSGQIKKIALLVGHGAGDSGAVGWNRVEEHDYNSAVATIIKDMKLNKEIKVFYKSKSGWGKTYVEVAQFAPDLSIEMHLNAANGKAYGCEVLVLNGQSSTAQIGKSFAFAFTQKFSRRIRGDAGIKWISSGDRGYGNLVGASVVSTWSILIEPFFIDTESEWIEISNYAKFLGEWIKGL